MTNRTEPYPEMNREDSDRACCRKCRYFHLPNCWYRRYPPVIVQLPNNSMVSYYPHCPDGRMVRGVQAESETGFQRVLQVRLTFQEINREKKWTIRHI